MTLGSKGILNSVEVNIYEDLFVNFSTLNI